MSAWTERIGEEIAQGLIPVLHLHRDDWLQVVQDPVPWLTEAEQIRAARYQREQDRLAFCAGRWMIRQTLGIWTGGPEYVDLETPAGGKPFSPHPATPAFNLSHAGDWVALALSGQEPLGVDVEDTGRRVRSRSALSRRYFSPSEQAVVDTDPHAGFFRIWTRREARVKADGLGIASGFAGLDTLEEEQRGHWCFEEWELGPSLRGALAYAPPGDRMRLYRLFPAEERLQSL